MTHLVRISIFLIRECAVSTLQHNNEYVRTSNVFKVSHGFNPASGEGATHSGGSGSGSGRYQETAQNGTYVCSTLFTCIYNVSVSNVSVSNVSVSNVSVSVIRNVHFKKRSWKKLNFIPEELKNLSTAPEICPFLMLGVALLLREIYNEFDSVLFTSL